MIGFSFVGRKLADGRVEYTTGWGTWMAVEIAITQAEKLSSICRKIGLWWESPKREKIASNEGLDGWNTAMSVEEYVKIPADDHLLLEGERIYSWNKETGIFNEIIGRYPMKVKDYIEKLEKIDGDLLVNWDDWKDNSAHPRTLKEYLKALKKRKLDPNSLARFDRRVVDDVDVGRVFHYPNKEAEKSIESKFVRFYFY